MATKNNKTPDTPATEKTAPEATEKQQAASSSKETKTAAKTAALKIAKGIFDASLAIKNLHITSDGTAFYTLNDAKNYARTLKNKEVVSLKREDIK